VLEHVPTGGMRVHNYDPHAAKRQLWAERGRRWRCVPRVRERHRKRGALARSRVNRDLAAVTRNNVLGDV